MQKNDFTVTREENYIHSSRSVKFYLRSNVQKKAAGSVVIVHGVGEHLDRYGYLENWLVEKGYNCYLYDHRGFGRSGGKKADVLTFNDYVEDLNKVHEYVTTGSRNLPIYVFGHSMGSLVVLLSLIKYAGRWNAAIVSGVPLQLANPIPKWQERLGRKVVRYMPALYLSSGIDPAILSHDPEVIADYVADPLNQQKITLRWGVAFIDAINYALSHLKSISDPLLILHGGQDRISNVQGAKLLANTISSQRKKLIIYPGLYHELHNEYETDRNRVFQDISEWLKCNNSQYDLVN